MMGTAFEKCRLWQNRRHDQLGEVDHKFFVISWTSTRSRTNRFVRKFEIWVHPDTKHDVNIGAALGVLKSAREEYALGLAVEYHRAPLSLGAALFEGFLDEATYLQGEGILAAPQPCYLERRWKKD